MSGRPGMGRPLISPGVMGYKAPNIDRIAREGALFTDAYAQQSCTAGHASFDGMNPANVALKRQK